MDTEVKSMTCHMQSCSITVPAPTTSYLNVLGVLTQGGIELPCWCGLTNTSRGKLLPRKSPLQSQKTLGNRLALYLDCNQMEPEKLINEYFGR